MSIVGKFCMDKTVELIVSVNVPAAWIDDGLLSLSKINEKVPEL